MFTILIVLIALICASIVFLVVIQNSKGGGLASNLQGAAVASQLMGVRRAADVVEKATWWMISLLVVLSIGANMILVNTDDNRGKNELRLKSALSGQKVNTNPTAVPNPNALPKGDDKPAEKK